MCFCLFDSFFLFVISKFVIIFLLCHFFGKISMVEEFVNRVDTTVSFIVVTGVWTFVTHRLSQLNLDVCQARSHPIIISLGERGYYVLFILKWLYYYCVVICIIIIRF